MTFTEVQYDLLKEAMNIGVGLASSALSDLAGGEEILLSVPEITLLDVKDLQNEIAWNPNDNISCVSEIFRGPFNGRAMMLYSHEESLELVKIMVGETIPIEQLSEMEGEALVEVGNIVLNACLSAIANLLGSEIETDIPCLHIGTFANVVNQNTNNTYHQVLYMKMTFSLAVHQLTGHIGFFLTFETAQELAKRLEELFLGIMDS